VLALDIVGQMTVAIGAGQSVHVEQSLIDVLLERQRRLDALERRLPLVLLGLLDILEDDATTARILIFHELVGPVARLVRALLEELAETGQ